MNMLRCQTVFSWNGEHFKMKSQESIKYNTSVDLCHFTSMRPNSIYKNVLVEQIPYISCV